MNQTKILYGNIKVLSPSGEVMFKTVKERADWYVERGLAVFETPEVLKLKFEPKGPGHAEDPYFLQDFQNRCVVCGTEKSLSHHHIVPECYRKYFARESEESGKWMYDVLLLCRPCHKKYEGVAWVRKEQIAKDLGVPIEGETNCDLKMMKAIKAAYALHRHGKSIPEERKAVLIRDIEDQVGWAVDPSEYVKLRKEMIRSIWRIPMGKLVMEKVQFLDAFAIGWREHFVKTMNPNHLPKGWVVERMIYG